MERKNTQSRRKQILFMAQFSILLGIEALVCFTILGSIPMFGIVATVAMVPVIITSILLGTKAGTLMGFFAGLFSFIVWTFVQPGGLGAFLFTPFDSLDIGNFWSIVICFVPRILVGTVTGLSYQFFSKRFKKDTLRDLFQYGISAILGSLTNTILVMTGLIIFFAKPYAEIIMQQPLSWGALFGAVGLVIAQNGVLEAVLAFVLAIAICKPVKTYFLTK